MTRKTLLTLAVLTAISAGTAFAATPAAPAAKPEARVKLDANNDGFIDRAEEVDIHDRERNHGGLLRLSPDPRRKVRLKSRASR